MTTTRTYAISCKGKPDDTLTGNFHVAAYDAAKNYLGLYLPGFTMISCRYVKVQNTEKHGLHTLWKAEAINHETQMGEVIWVREL